MKQTKIGSWTAQLYSREGKPRPRLPPPCPWPSARPPAGCRHQAALSGCLRTIWLLPQEVALLPWSRLSVFIRQSLFSLKAACRGLGGQGVLASSLLTPMLLMEEGPASAQLHQHRLHGESRLCRTTVHSQLCSLTFSLKKNSFEELSNLYTTLPQQCKEPFGTTRK